MQTAIIDGGIGGTMMHCISQANRNCGQSKRRLVALSLLLCFVVASLSATIFIITQADHDCTGESCLVCAQIHNAQELLERIGKTAVVISIAAVGIFTAVTAWTKLYFFECSPSTLVSVKVRLNN